MALDLGERETALGVFIPPGVAHGFAALADMTLTYLGRRVLQPGGRASGWPGTDPEIGADWGVSGPVVSERDRANPRRSDLPTGPAAEPWGLRT